MFFPKAVVSFWNSFFGFVFGVGGPQQKDSTSWGPHICSLPGFPYTCSWELAPCLALEREQQKSDLPVCGTWTRFPSEHAHLNEQQHWQKNPEENFVNGGMPKSIQQYIQSRVSYRKLKEGTQNYCRRLLNLMLSKRPLGSETERFGTC